MKPIFQLLIVACLSTIAQAQTLPGINYQALVRDVNGQAIASKPVQMQVSILFGSTTGTTVYSETHNATTNAFGQINLSICEGEPTVGVFDAINWGNGIYYLKTAIDLTGSGEYKELETVRFYSVPYSYHSNTADIANVAGSVPSMTSAERDAIENPTVGMQIFNTTTKSLNIYSGTTWIETSGNEKSCGESFVDQRDGHEYNTVKIGNQCWMTENLAWLPRVSPSSQGSETDIFYYVYNYQGTNVTEAKASQNYTQYGVLYNAPASLYACPSGWNLPTDAEWCELSKYLDPTVDCSVLGWSGTNAGGKLKEAGTAHWSAPNTGATNESGFAALPGGARDYNGSFTGFGQWGYWWSSSIYDLTRQLRRTLAYDSSKIYGHHYPKSVGFSVRCIRE